MSKIRKRGGQFAGSINGAATWYDAWYDRVMSEDTAAKLADLGVNLVVLPFSVGGSARMEQFEHDDFERMTRHLHAHGIVSLPYLQYQNILQEDFTFENTTWGVKLDGSRKQYCYWRHTACQSSPEFLEYFKGLITNAVRRGADGIWIDNTHHIPCQCVLCVRKFKDWLNKNRHDLLNELHLENFEKIEMPPQAGGVDPIAQALLDFNGRLNLDILDEFKSHMAALKPDALFASNPGLSRGSNNYDRGMDLQPMLQLHDMMYLENKFFPGIANGQTTGNFHGYIACEEAGCIGIPGAWQRHDFDATAARQSTGMPETEPEIRRVIFEAAACGGAPGMLWAIRTRPEHMCDKPEDLLTMYFEHPVIYSGMKKSLDFALSDMLQVSRFKRGNEFVHAQYGAGQCATLPLAGASDVPINNINSIPKLCFPAWHAKRHEILETLDKLLGADRQIRMIEPKDICVTLRRTESGATAMHFLAYATQPGQTTLKVLVHAGLCGTEQPVWHTPEGGAQPINPAGTKAGYNEYQLPGFADYGVLC